MSSPRIDTPGIDKHRVDALWEKRALWLFVPLLLSFWAVRWSGGNLEYIHALGVPLLALCLYFLPKRRELGILKGVFFILLILWGAGVVATLPLFARFNFARFDGDPVLSRLQDDPFGGKTRQLLQALKRPGGERAGERSRPVTEVKLLHKVVSSVSEADSELARLGTPTLLLFGSESRLSLAVSKSSFPAPKFSAGAVLTRSYRVKGRGLSWIVFPAQLDLIPSAEPLYSQIVSFLAKSIPLCAVGDSANVRQSLTRLLRPGAVKPQTRAVLTNFAVSCGEPLAVDTKRELQIYRRILRRIRLRDYPEISAMLLNNSAILSAGLGGSLGVARRSLLTASKLRDRDGQPVHSAMVASENLKVLFGRKR